MSFSFLRSRARLRASTRLALPVLLVLTACDLPLPSGAYEPDDLDLKTGIGDAGRSGDAMVDLPPVPGGTMTGTPDSGGTGDDSGVASGDEQRLQALAGRYLMRMDMFSKATVDALPGLQLVTRNRISHLLVSELYVEGGELKSNERLCHQTFAHACEKGCTTLKTVMLPQVTDKLVGIPPSARSYTLSGSELSGNSIKMLLGFDFSANQALPTSNSDNRVWDIGGTAGGMMAHLDSTGLFAVSCNVFSVQTFASKLSGRLGGSAAAPSLVGQSFTLDTTGAIAKSLGASDSKCTDKGGPDPVQGQQTVRFFAAPYLDRAALFGCPDAALWEQDLPAAAP